MDNKKEIKYLDKELTLEFMKVPTVSYNEVMVQAFIKKFAIDNEIDCLEDSKGNLYLTKGKSDVYPCITAHMDSVQPHEKYIKNGKLLDVIELTVNVTNSETKEKELCTKVYAEGVGLGCDDKCGIAIALSMIKKLDILKCAFFVEEEVGCLGSAFLDYEFFSNVGYVIGYDSPEVNRAAHTCSGVQLFTKEFHEKHIKDICEKWGVTKFYSEPYTDVKNIREDIPVQCMNFGSGYYNMHSPLEYCILEHMDNACGMGLDIIQSLGNVRYEFPCEDFNTPWNFRHKDNEDTEYLKTLGDNDKWSSYSRFTNFGKTKKSYKDDYDYDYYNDCGYWDADGYFHAFDEDEKDTKLDEDYIDLDTLYNIIMRYEEREDDIKESIREKCIALGIDYETEFEPLFNVPFPFEMDCKEDLPF